MTVPASAQRRSCAVRSALITVTAASHSSSPVTLRSASLPPPTTTQRLSARPIRKTGYPFILSPQYGSHATASTWQHTKKPTYLSKRSWALGYSRIMPYPALIHSLSGGRDNTPYTDNRDTWSRRCSGSRDRVCEEKSVACSVPYRVNGQR